MLSGGYASDDNLTRVETIYENFDEDMRLQSNVGKLEFITTVKYIEDYLKKGDKILDLGAGTGAYSLYFANRGYDVTAVELLEKHSQQISVKYNDDNLEVITADALKFITNLPDNSMEIILCFGPIYHLIKREERIEMLKECRRVVKEDGKVFISIINHDNVIIVETFRYSGVAMLDRNDLPNTNFRIENIPFIFHTLDEFKEMLEESNLKLEKLIAQNGIAETVSEKLNEFSDEHFKKWLDFHLHICEKPEFQGISSHNLFICSK